MHKLSLFVFTFIAFFLGFAYGADIKLTSKTLEIWGTDNSIRASGNVVIRDAQTQIKSQEATYFLTTRFLSFQNNVELTKDGIYLSCQKLEADLNQDFFSAKQAINFNYQNDLTGKAERAEYWASKKMLYLFDNAFAQQGADQIHGDKLVIDLAQKKFQTIGKTSVIIAPERFQ